MKAFPTLHAEYTLHDATHLLRVTELMSMLMPAETADHLNPVELALLILAAHFHDQGMVLSSEELVALRGNNAFALFKDNWIISHPNLREIQELLRNRTLSPAELDRCREAERELHGALLSDFIRMTHGKRSALFMLNEYGSDPRLEIDGVNIAPFVARLCASHVRPASDLSADSGFRYDEVIGRYRVNLTYLGLVLRLADILDFDRERTPDSLFKTITFHSAVSLQEWAKHRAVTGWVIQPNLVQFTMQCEHPEYQRAAYAFMDMIDRELAQAQAMCRNFPSFSNAYRLDLPGYTDRSRIEPKDGSYIYLDLEFTLSRDEIVKLLMTEELYDDPSLCVRELLQNSLDALRHRRAVIARDIGSPWEQGRIELIHEVDAGGYEIVRCTDNGIGMDQAIIERFLTRAGRSYYRSPEFEQERLGFRARGVDFEPCAQFGIGFMSCFMLGDRISIETRKDLGPASGQGEPLVVEISGLSSIVVVRKGPAHQPVGTSVIITGRLKPGFLDRYSDKVRLVPVVDGYALAAEFPITATCRIPELRRAIAVPPSIAERETTLERLGFRDLLSFEASFNEIDPSLRGKSRLSVLADEGGRPALSRGETRWVQQGTAGSTTVEKQFPQLMTGDLLVSAPTIGERGTVCNDGILVAGEPGRGDQTGRSLIAHWHSGIHCGRLVDYIVDVRGPIKPPTTPARRPPQRPWREEPRWQQIQAFVSRSEGRLLEQLAVRCAGLDPELFWTIAFINGPMSVGWTPAAILYSDVRWPSGNDTSGSRWVTMENVGPLEPVISEDGSLRLRQEDGAWIGFCPSLRKWTHNGVDPIGNVTPIALALSTLSIQKGTVRLEVRVPREPRVEPFWNMIYAGGVPHDRVYCIPYAGDAHDLLAVQLPVANVNSEHPLVRAVLESRWLVHRTDFQTFASALIHRVARADSTEPPRYHYWEKRIGHLHRDVQWEDVGAEFQPPYKVYSPQHRLMELTHEVFDEWADRHVDIHD